MSNHYQKLLDRLQELGFSDSQIAALTYSSEWFFQSNQFLRKSTYPAIIAGDYDKLQHLTLSLLEGSFA
jgi:hypothetical protein